MLSVQYTAEVKGGLLLELPAEAEQLHLKPGDKVRIQVEQSSPNVQGTTSNEGMISALSEIAARQKGRRHTDGSNTDAMLREARAGAMWGCDPIE